MLFINFFSKSEFPKIIFTILIALLIRYGLKHLVSIIHALYKDIKDYNCKSNILYINSRHNRIKRRELYYDTKELRRKITKHFCRYTMPRLCRVIISIILVFALCFVNPINAKALWEDMNEIVKIIFDLPSDDMSELQTEQQKSDIEFSTEIDNLAGPTENEKERKPPGYKFVLANPDKIFKLDSYIEEQVYFYDDNSTFSSDLITKYLLDLKENKISGLNIEDILDDEENKFKSEVAKYMGIEYLDDWYEVAPSSDELDAYIQKREELNNLKVDGKQGCYELWWRLANDYQYYALEFEMQTNNETAVLYYYSMSIYCCMKALEYEVNDDVYDMIYHYMAMRYHDICRDECIISSSYKKTAEKIYYILEPNAIN